MQILIFIQANKKNKNNHDAHMSSQLINSFITHIHITHIQNKIKKPKTKNNTIFHFKNIVFLKNRQQIITQNSNKLYEIELLISFFN